MQGVQFQKGDELGRGFQKDPQGTVPRDNEAVFPGKAEP